MNIWVDADEDWLVIEDETGTRVVFDICHASALCEAIEETAKRYRESRQ